MSFSPPRDTGSPPAPAARGFVLGPDDGDPYHWLGTLTLTKIRGVSTGGDLDIVDHRVPPGYAPPRHVHQRADEIFFLLDGHLEVTCGDDTWQAGQGSLIFLPRGIPHQFTAASDGPARTLLINATRTRAVEDGGEWRLTGCKTPVVSGDAADVLLVHAGTETGPALFAVRSGAPGLTRTRLRTLDPTRRLARVELAATPAVRLAGDVTAALALAGDLAAVALAAEQAGVMRRALEITVDYAKVRVQFGRAIGSYQAVKHACADMYVACEQALSAVRYATWAADHDRAELPLAAALCRVYVAPTCFEVARSMVLIHGGVGYTWEHDAHLYYKRAKADELLLGAPQEALLRLAGLVGC